MRPCNTDLMRGAFGGGVSAGILVFTVISITLILYAIQDARIAGLLPLLIITTVAKATLASGVGTLAGALGTTTGKPFLGGLVGTLIFLLVSLVYVFGFVSPVEPRSESTIVVVWSVITGYISGSVGTIAGCRSSDSIAVSKLSMFLKRTLLFMPPIILVIVWSIVDENDRHVRVEMAARGCIVTWNAIEHPEGRWEVRFQDSRINDLALMQLIGSLARYSPLDLDLSHSQVTDQGIPYLKTLTNLVRLHLENTSISNEAIAKLRNQLPQLTITK